MPFHIVQGDITKLTVDAIVNAANNSLLGGGGVDGAIHRAAGPQLLEACRPLHGCQTGEAKITPGFRLPAKYVIHTVGPIWHGGQDGEPELLASAYRRSLELASENQCESVAFPLISSGVYGYPLEQALNVAVTTIRDFLDEHEMDVTLVIFSKRGFRMDGHIYEDLNAYLSSNLAVEPGPSMCFGAMAQNVPNEQASPKRRVLFSKEKKAKLSNSAVSMQRMQDDMEVIHADMMMDSLEACAEKPKRESKMSLQEALENLDESFSQSLLRMIDERGMTDAECYKKANIDRKLFSKIRSDMYYRPSKQTVLAFAVALELNLEETEALLKKAGFAFSHASKSDVIVEYFIAKGEYDMYAINEALFAFDQHLLGA